MIGLASLLLAQALEVPAWAGKSGSISFSIYASEITQEGPRTAVWLREYDPLPGGKFQLTMLHESFDCHGYVWVTASTVYAPDGSVTEDWDGSNVHIVRPNSVESAVEGFACHKR